MNRGRGKKESLGGWQDLPKRDCSPALDEMSGLEKIQILSLAGFPGGILEEGGIDG